MSPRVIVDDVAGVRVLTMNRPEARNALVGRMTTPIIGAINGATFTGGLELALGCDILIASERAVFADTHARVGVLPGGGLTARLPQLVSELVAHEDLIDRALELATSIAEVPAETMRALKDIYVSGAAGTIGAGLAAERAAAADHRTDLALLESGERR